MNVRAADRYMQRGERDKESTRPRTETLEASRLYSTSPWRMHPRILGTHRLNNCLHSVERHSTAPMLLSCWSDSLGSIPKGSLSIFQLYCLAVPCVLYHENTRLGASSISRHKARSGGFGTRIRGVWSSNPTRDNAALATVDRNQMEGQLLSSVEVQRLTRIPGVMWEVASRCKWGPPRIGAAASGCNCHAGDQPGSGTRVYSQLPAGGSRLGFKSGLVGLGKDASAPTSTDRIASHQRTRFPKMAQMRRQEKTLGNGTSRLPSAPAPTTRTRHSSPAHRPDALETTTPQARGRSADQSSPTPRRSSGSAGGRSAGGAPSGGRLSREGLWTVSRRGPFIKGAHLATRGPELHARSSPRGGSSHFPSDSPINPGRHGEAALTRI